MDLAGVRLHSDTVGMDVNHHRNLCQYCPRAMRSKGIMNCDIHRPVTQSEYQYKGASTNCTGVSWNTDPLLTCGGEVPYIFPGIVCL